MIHTGRVCWGLCIAALLFSPGCGGNGDKSSAPKTDSKSTSRKSPRIAPVDPPNTPPQVPAVAGKTQSKSVPSANIPPEPKPKKKPKPQTVFRRSDDRPRHDDAKLAKLGIRRYASKRIILYTDIAPKIATRLPAYVDQAYPAWVAYFGKLPPTRERSEFQVTGYIMADAALFKRAGLVPVNLPPFLVGRHRGYEFWMNDQKWDYFRRHTMLHEATHCFMYANRDVRFPVWYMEGMADYFGTHWTDRGGVTHFGVMPQHRRDFEGFARIDFIRQYVAEKRTRSIDGVRRITADDTGKQEPYAYAWSWSLCKFLNEHPRYGKRFRELGRILTGARFEYEFGQFVQQHSSRINMEWALYIQGLDYGYDLQRAAIDVIKGEPLAPGSTKSIDLATNRGWQSSAIRVEKGKTYRVQATGKFIIAEQPKPWVCEPQGVSILYAGGQPLGKVVATVWPDDAPENPASGAAPPVIPIGRGRDFKATQTGTMYFRVNDLWSSLENNTGTLKLIVHASKP